jgi:arylsulfatase A-like enzyme
MNRHLTWLTSYCLLLLATTMLADERPNILICIADDVSFPHASAYGCSWVKTPAFDRVAREGLLFTRAYTPNAKCSPSRACLLTGRNSWQLEAAANHTCFFPAKFKTYCESLGEHGYFVGFTGKGWSPGDAGMIDGKPRQLTGRSFSERRADPPAKGMSNVDYAANFGAFLADRPQGKPFCFWFGGFEPHRAYEAGAGQRLGGKKLADIDRVPGFWPDNETVRGDMLDYAFEIEHFDAHLHRMLAALEAAGELDNTLVVVTSDNGMPFPRCKGQSYEFSNHLPLAVMWKRGITKPGRRIDDFVSFIDFAPTFLEVAGVTSLASGMQPIQGRSLMDIFASSQSGQVDPRRDHVLIGKERHDVGRPHDQGYPIRGIVQGHYFYLRNYEPSRWPGGNPETGYLETDGSPTKTECLQARTKPGLERFWRESFGKKPAEELFDLRTDPDCLVNLAERPEHAKTKQSLAQRMTAELTEQSDPRMAGQGNVFDEYPYAHAAIRGFYERFRRGENVKAGWITPTDIEKEPLD